MSIIQLMEGVFLNINAISVAEFKVEKNDYNVNWEINIKNHNGEVIYQKTYSCNKNDNISISNIKKEIEGVSARFKGLSEQDKK